MMIAVRRPEGVVIKDHMPKGWLPRVNRKTLCSSPPIKRPKQWLREQDVGGTGHPPDHGKKHQKIYVDKIALFFLCLQDKKSGHESQGVVKKKVF